MKIFAIVLKMKIFESVSMETASECSRREGVDLFPLVRRKLIAQTLRLFTFIFPLISSLSLLEGHKFAPSATRSIEKKQKGHKTMQKLDMAMKHNPKM